MRSCTVASVAVVLLCGVLVAPVASLAQSTQSTGSVSGRVADGYGEPIRGAMVEALSVSGYAEKFRTGRDGAFRFPVLVAGSYTFRFAADGYRSDTRLLIVEDGVPLVLRLSLDPLFPAAIRGLVLDEQGLALPGALVEARYEDDEPLVLVAEEGGEFRISPARPGAWRVSANLSGFSPDAADVTVAFSAPAQVSLVLDLDYGVAEEVVVVGSRRQTEQRTVSASVVPVDVMTAEDLVSQPRTDMAELVRALA